MSGTFCYHKNMSGRQAAELLRKVGKDGSFLVRDSESVAGVFVLTFLHQSVVQHLRILTIEDGRLYPEDSNDERVLFNDINEVVKWFMQKGDSNGAFKHPVPAEKTEGVGIQINEEEDSFKDLPVDEACRDRSTPDIQSGLCPGPSVWSTGSTLSQEDFADHYAVVKVEETSDEFKVVTDLFYASLPRDVKIISLERVENGEMWNSFDILRKKMKKKARRTGTFKELRLFHGTTSGMIGAICRQGFDFRLSGVRIGHRFGKGSYFAKDAKYSDSYADKSDKNMKMFLARVLVGEYIDGDKNYVRPPAKSSENPHDLYDSCVDDATDPKIFVVFTLEQAYPEYIITYEGCTDIGQPDPDGVDPVL